MDLWCSEGPEDNKDYHIILPNELKLQKLNLFVSKDNTSEKLIRIVDNFKNIQQMNVKKFEEIIDLSKIVSLFHRNLEQIKDIPYYYSIGDQMEKFLIGPILHVIPHHTIAEVNGDKYVFYNQNLFQSTKKYLLDGDKQIGISPADDLNKDKIILIVENGCIVVNSKGLLIFDWPIIVVKTDGNYFTLNKSQRCYLYLKSGVHLAIFAQLSNKITVPVIFIRQQKEIQTIDSIPKIFSENQEKSISESIIQSNEEIVETEEEKPMFEELFEEFKQKVFPFIEMDLKVEYIIVNDLSDNKLIPNYIFDWIYLKGYEMERGGGSALLSMSLSSVVRRGKRLSDSTAIAVKIIVSDLNEINLNNNKAPKELLIAQCLNHPNIVEIYDVLCVISKISNRIDKMHSFVVMELASNQTLEKIIETNGPLNESKAKTIFKQIINAVVYLHSHLIAHCRLVLDNCLMFDNGVIKICDFSRAINLFLSKTIELKTNKVLSLKYMPPEFFDTTEFDVLKVDIWMAGCILFGLLTGNTSPFGRIKQIDRITNSKEYKYFRNRQNYGILNNINVSENALNLLSKMFKTDPTNRIDAQLVLDHQWLN